MAEASELARQAAAAAAPTGEPSPPPAATTVAEDFAESLKKVDVPPEKVWQFFIRRFRERRLG